MRFSQLLCCGGPDDDGQKDASPPPAYRSIEGNPAATQSLPNLQPRKIAFYISPSSGLANDRDGDGVVEKAEPVDTKGKGRLLRDDSDRDAQEHKRDQDVSRLRQGAAQSVSDNTFLMPNGREVTLNTNDDFVQATLAAAQTSDQALDQWLALGYGIEIKDSRKRSAATWAVLQNHSGAIRRFIDRGANVNLGISNTCTELHRAVSEGNEKLVVTLLKHKADVNAIDNEGNTPLHCALNHWLKTDESEDFSIFKLLVEKGAADLEAHNRYGNTVLHEACIYGDGMPLRYMPGSSAPPPAITSRRLVLAKTLLDLGIPMDTRDKWGSTPLLRCCTMQTPDRDVIALLLDRGADVNAPNNHGDTALDTVCFQRDTELLKQIAARVININITANDKRNDDHDNANDDNDTYDDNQPDPATAALFNKPTVLSTPLHYAAQHSGPDRLLFLLSHGANPSTPTYATGATPLHLLASSKPITADRPTSPSPSFNTPPTPPTKTVITTTTRPHQTDHITQNIHLLTTYGADINAHDLTGATPLHYAARNVESRYQERIVTALLAAGAEPNCKDSKGRTPLGDLEGFWVLKGAVVKRLVEAGAEKVPGMEGLGGFEYMDRDGVEG
ncbi:ankyrin repeat protein [Blastomyces dermatitidis ER-3]|uniref:Ankyrin repeat protein n=1 Tax=Ajellomyces dermatitidis (strain ER-3 / ATCC MYA-2586) TaxID=559297 RepID=A0ABP2F5Z5_AJEDR|nr:ankyrin repeat protein [Blastomyces dermatitidis ER-3]EEQ90915.1 ankyrin repeat protein [Blastomyces dermatitidis ER-3]